MTRLGDSGKTRYLYHYTRAGAGVRYGAHSADINTLERGVIERIFLHKEDGVMVPPYRPERVVVQNMLRAFKAEVAQRSMPLTPWSYDHFVASYGGRKRKIYESAKIMLEERGLLAKDRELKTFVKFEKLNLTKKPDPAPRVIQPRSPVWNIAVGVYIRPLEGVLYKVINEVFGEVTVVKGLNARQRGEVFARKWAKFKDPIAISADAKRFDQHCSRAMLTWQNSIYDLFYGSRNFRNLLRQMIRQVGRARCADGFLKYVSDGCRASGDMDTALGNCLLMCAIMWSYFNHVGLRAELVDDGDDSVTIMERADLHLFNGLPEYAGRLGFPMELEVPVDELEDIDFCQQHPVFDGESWIMVRDPRVCIDKDLASVKPLRNKREYDVMRGSIGDCGLSLAGSMPVFCEFYQMLVRGAGSRRDRDQVMTGMRYLARGLDEGSKVVTEAARYSFYKAFDITPEAQYRLEESFRETELDFEDCSEFPRHESPCWSSLVATG